MKVKFLIAALFFSLVAAAQPSNYIKFNTRGRWIAGMFDSTLHVPRFNGSPSLRTGGSSMDGAIAVDTANGVFYFYYNGAWKRANLDTSAYAVTSVYRKTASDSVFYVKGGTHTFAFKDSTGGGIPTLQQVLTAGSTLTGGNDINLDGNEFRFLGGSGDFLVQDVNLIDLINDNDNGIQIGTAEGVLIKPNVGVLKIDTLNYTLSTTGKKILIRDTATGLVQNIDPSLLGASSYTFTNGLTESGGTVKLGGTLMEAITTIDADGNDLVIKSNSTVLSSSIYLSGQDLDLFANSGGPEPSSIRLKGDSLEFEPLLGRMSIDTLAAASNMTNKRVMTWDTVTKRWEQIAKDSVGGGGSTSPGGSTKQIQYNNAGAFGGAAGFEYQSGSSPNVTITAQNAAHVPLYVKGIGSTQTADLFRVMRYDDSAMFRIAANGSVTIGPQYDYVNAHHAPEHVFKYSNSGYTGGIKLRNHNSGSEVRLHTVNNGLYITDNGGTAAPMTLGTRTNPADASTFIAASGTWTISAGRFGVGGTAHASAIIDATSTSKGFLPPRMTGTQAEAITSPAEGLMVYATDGSGTTITSKGWWGYDGSTWVKLN